MAFANLMIVQLSTMNGANLSLDWTRSAVIETALRIKKADQEFAPQDLPLLVEQISGQPW